MSDPRRPPRRRARALVAAAMAALVLVLSGGIVILGPASPAQATAVTISGPTGGAQINTPTRLFTGAANPNEPITVRVISPYLGPVCNVVADGLGNWTCTVQFTQTAQATQVQAVGSPHGTPDAASQTLSYPVVFPPTITEDKPGLIAEQNGINPFFSGTATPNAAINGSINAVPCATVASAAGAYTCTTTQNIVDGDYPVSVTQTPPLFLAPSAATLSTYRRDTAVAIPNSNLPAPSTGFTIVDTTNPSQTVSGVAGTAESYGTVQVYAYDFGAGVPNAGSPNPGTAYCSGQADASGAWSCAGAINTPGHYWVFGMTQTDLAGNSTGSPDTEFAVHLLAPPPPPVITLPTPNFGGISPFSVVGTAPVAVPNVNISIDGGLPVCSPPVNVGNYGCATPVLAPGPHTVSVYYTDAYGTNAVSSRNVTSWAPPVITAPAPGYQSSTPNTKITLAVPAGANTSVRVDGATKCAAIAATATFTCMSGPLQPGAHTIDADYRDSLNVLSATVSRVFTILPAPPKIMLKTFTFTFQLVRKSGAEGLTDLVGGESGILTASGLPVGAVVTAEFHSTPVSLGLATVGPDGRLALPVTIPDVETGSHEIVATAVAPGYSPTTASTPLTLAEAKVMEASDESPSPSSTATPTPEPTDEPGLENASDNASSTAASDPGFGFDDPSQFAAPLVSPFDLVGHAFQLSPLGFVVTGGIGVAFLLLVGLPAELLESTIRSNYDRAFGWLAPLRRRWEKIKAPIARALANPWIASGLTILAASVMLGFADPEFGFNGGSVRLLIAMMLSVVVINVGLSVILMRVARRAFDVSAVLQPMPAALALVAVSVLVSRLAGISPGFLFGVVLSVTWARELRLRDEGRLGLLGVGLTIGAGMLAWLGFGFATLASGSGFWYQLLIDSLAAITLEALGTLVIALLPIDFLDGRTIFRWSKPVWIALYVLVGIIFLLVVVPMSGNWGQMSAPIFGWGTLFAVFAVVAIVTWALFRRFPRRATPSNRQAATRRPPAPRR